MSHYGVYSGSTDWIKHPDATPKPDTIISPGYPWFLRHVPGLAPTEAFIRRVSLLQAGMGVLSVLLVYLIGVRFLTRPAALAASLTTALSPHLAVISTNVLTESLFLFLLLTSLLASIVSLQRDGRLLAVVAGIAWALCSLVRPTMQLLPFLIMAAVLFVPALRLRRAPAAWLLLAFFVTMSPWFIDKARIGSPQGSPDLAVKFVHHGSYPGFMYEGRPESFGYPYMFDPANTASSKDMHAAVANIAQHFRHEPGRYLVWYVVGKPVTFLSWGIINGFGDIFTYPPIHSPYLEDIRFALIRAAMYWLHVPLMVLGVLGAIVAWLPVAARRLPAYSVPAIRLVSLVVAYAIGLHMIGAPFPRYGIPFRPLLLLLAAFAASLPFLRPAMGREPTADVSS